MPIAEVHLEAMGLACERRRCVSDEIESPMKSLLLPIIIVGCRQVDPSSAWALMILGMFLAQRPKLQASRLTRLRCFGSFLGPWGRVNSSSSSGAKRDFQSYSRAECHKLCSSDFVDLDEPYSPAPSCFTKIPRATSSAEGLEQLVSPGAQRPPIARKGFRVKRFSQQP